MRNINDNTVQGRLSENYLTPKIIAQNILNTKYLRLWCMIDLAFCTSLLYNVLTSTGL